MEKLPADERVEAGSSEEAHRLLEIVFELRVGGIVVDELPVEVLQQDKPSAATDTGEFENRLLLIGQVLEQEAGVDEVELAVTERQSLGFPADRSCVRVGRK